MVVNSDDKRAFRACQTYDAARISLDRNAWLWPEVPGFVRIHSYSEQAVPDLQVMGNALLIPWQEYLPVKSVHTLAALDL